MAPAIRPLAVLLPLLATAAAWPAHARGDSAEESAPEEAARPDQDIYAAHRAIFRQAGPAISAEGFTTALIKKHLAMLMYPVDLGVFKPPEQDERFRDQIRLFQGRLGVPATGTLTLAQFQKLQEAAVTAGERRVLPPAPLVVRREGAPGSEVARALGSWFGTGRPLPLNYAEVVCRQAEQSCQETLLKVTIPAPQLEEIDYRLGLASRSYRILSWGDPVVEAEADGPCGPQRLAIDTRAGRASRTEAGDCPAAGEEAAAAVLSAGAQAADRYYAARRAEALRLSHDPFRP